MMVGSTFPHGPASSARAAERRSRRLGHEATTARFIRCPRWRWPLSWWSSPSLRSPRWARRPARPRGDIQTSEGIWLDVYDTPLERVPELGDREFATAEERAARDEARRTPGRNIRGPRGSAQDASGAYNAVFSSAKPAGPRTSLVVDPPNGADPGPDAGGAAGRGNPARLAGDADAEHADLRATGARLRGRAIRAGVPAPVRRPAFLQHVADEPPRRTRRSEPWRSVHAGRHAGPQRVPAHRAGRGLRRDRLRHGAGPGLPAHRLFGREPPIEPDPSSPWRLAGALGGGHAGHRDHEFLPEVPRFAARA